MLLSLPGKALLKARCISFHGKPLFLRHISLFSSCSVYPRRPRFLYFCRAGRDLFAVVSVANLPSSGPRRRLPLNWVMRASSEIGAYLSSLAIRSISPCEECNTSKWIRGLFQIRCISHIGYPAPVYCFNDRASSPMPATKSFDPLVSPHNRSYHLPDMIPRHLSAR
jgi:hypothetical protein